VQPDEITYAYLGNLTKSRDDKGFLHIKGLASDDTLDLDGQICDPEWLKSAMPQWFKTGNIREMHQLSAVGKAHKLTQKGTGFEIEAKIVDAQAALKFDEEIYTGLSIGIKGARVDESEDALKRAPKGVIIGGRIVEISGVDLPANPSAVLELVKTVGGVTEKTEALGEITKSDNVKGDCETCDGTGKIKDGSTECPDCDGTGKAPSREGQKSADIDIEIAELTEKLAAAELAKRDYSTAQRKDMAANGQAEPDGSNPIKDVKDLHDAISTFGLNKNKPKAMAHIRARAKALDATKELPDEWKSAEGTITALDPDVTKSATDSQWMHDPTQLKAIAAGIGTFLKAEIDEYIAGENEAWDIQTLTGILNGWFGWWNKEASEGETEPPFTDDSGDDTMAYIAMGVSPDTIKAAVADDATDEQKAAPLAELRKSLGLDDILETIATKAEFDALQETIKGLEAGFKDVREMAAPGQPALRGSLEDQAKSAEADELTIKAAHYRATANSQTDPETAKQYQDAADKFERRLRELRTI
jgi:hypothetical protein